jgi:hypothetical protein
MTDAALSRIMRAVITCEAKVVGSHCLEKELGTPNFRYPNRSCSVQLRIQLPVGAENAFEDISGFKLSIPPKCYANAN